MLIYYFKVGANASSGEVIYYTDIAAKTFTTYSSSLYNRSSFVSDYYYNKKDIEINNLKIEN